MANRRNQNNNNNQRRMDYGRNDRGPKNFGRVGVSPWQGGGPGGAGISHLLPLGGTSSEATLALANNLITNLLQARQQPVPSLLDMPIRRGDFGPDMGRFDRGGFGGPNRMGNQGNFRRSGNYNRPVGDRMNNRRFKPGDGPRNQNKTTPKKDADSKSKTVKESLAEGKVEETPEVKTETTEDVQETKKEAPKTRYDDINPQLLKCHICNKSMWDGRSFENHLSGRAHGIMMQKTAESYALTADTMRQEFKIREMKRTRKTGQQTPRDFYCAMCDMYAGDGAAHRTTVGHRKLKKYLHPACTNCHKEMPTRIELDEHRLTPEHLKNVHDKQEVTSKPKPEVMVISTLSMEQSYVRDDRQRRRAAPGTELPLGTEPEPSQGTESETPQGTEPGTADKETGAEAGEKEGEESAEVKMEVDAEKAEPVKLVLDYQEGDDLSSVTAEMVPDYNTERGVGASFLSEFKCVQCLLCHKLLDSPATAAVHLRTWRHHQLYVRLLRDKANIQVPDANKRSLNRESLEQAPKRRKTSGGDEQNGHNDDADMKAEEPQSEGDVDTVAGGDWEQTVDDILQDEMTTENGAGDAEKAEEPKQEDFAHLEAANVVEEVKEQPPPEVAPAPAKPKPSPRGRGRGRPRRY